MSTPSILLSVAFFLSYRAALFGSFALTHWRCFVWFTGHSGAIWPRGCERGKVCICANAHRRSCTYIRTGNTDGLSCCKREKKAINRNSQWECWGEREALMSRWRHISVFHVERCEGRGNVTTNKINVQHKQARRDELWERDEDEAAVSSEENGCEWGNVSGFTPLRTEKKDLDVSRHVQKNMWVITLKMVWKYVTEVDKSTFFSMLKNFTLLTLLSHYSWV